MYICTYICICVCIHRCMYNYIYMDKEMATHSSILAWRIPWTQEPLRLGPSCGKKADTTQSIYHVCVCVCVCTCTCMLSLKLCLTLWDPMDCSLPGSSLHQVLQERTLEWVAMPSSWILPDPGIKPKSLRSPALTGEFFTTSATWEARMCMYVYIHYTLVLSRI